MTRVLVLADVHANLPALDAVLSAEPEADGAVFLGDAVDNGPHPDAVCRRLRGADLLAGLHGNHDRAVLAVGETDERRDHPYWRWKEWTYARLSEESRAFLRSLDRTVTISLHGRQLRLHHGDFPPPEGYDGEWLTRATPEENRPLFETVADRYREDVVLLGHSHFPFDDRVAGTRFVNPGSVGLQRAGWAADVARYATIDDCEVELRETRFDAAAVARDARGFDSPFSELWDQSSGVDRGE